MKVNKKIRTVLLNTPTLCFGFYPIINIQAAHMQVRNDDTPCINLKYAGKYQFCVGNVSSFYEQLRRLTRIKEKKFFLFNNLFDCWVFWGGGSNI